MTECLKWALANPDLTQTGVWAATPQARPQAAAQAARGRLGDDWPGVVTEQDRRRR
ncbi:hypothetical protein [Streptomyces griseus]|uniref:hypothetical protein n=1 Tax=Streptomyces griseus TaxID=1911 RepID=UPI00364CFDF1